MAEVNEIYASLLQDPPGSLLLPGSHAFLLTRACGWYLVRVLSDDPRGTAVEVAAHMNLSGNRGWPHTTPIIGLDFTERGQLYAGTDPPMPVVTSRPRKRR